jgi:hypothetical protein
MDPDQPSRNRFDSGQRVGAGPCRRSGGAGQPPAAGRGRRGRRASPAAPPLAIVLVGLVALAGCQSVHDPAPATQIGAVATTTSAADYPSLHSVPPRPQLTYSVQQRRAIVDGLVADRANARYTDRVVRYRTGRSNLPPPPAPPPVVATAEPEAPTGATAPPTPEGGATPAQPDANTAGGPSYQSDFGNDTLGDFVDQLVDTTAEPSPAAAGTDGEAAGAKSGGSGWFDWLRDLFGQAADPAQPSAAASPAAGPAVAPVAASAPIPAGAPPEAEAALTILVAETRPAFQPAANFQPAMAPARAGRRPPAAGPDPTGPTLAASEGAAPTQAGSGGLGIAIGEGEVAIEGGGLASAHAVPAVSTHANPPAASVPGAGRSAVRTAAAGPAAGTVVGRVAFAPGSAELPVGIGPQLEQALATARTQGALIRIVGEADAAALALDRARAVAIALVRLGARAGDLEMTLARHATGDQARLLLAAPAPR